MNLLAPVKSIMMYENTDFRPIWVKWSGLPTECIVCSLLRIQVVHVLSILLKIDLWLMMTPNLSDTL